MGKDVKFDIVNDIISLEYIDLFSVEAKEVHYVLMNFAPSRGEYKEMSAFAKDAISLNLKAVDTGKDGANLLVKFDRFWVTMDEEQELFFSLKYKPKMYVTDYNHMMSLLQTVTPGNSGVFLSMCMIGFIK